MSEPHDLLDTAPCGFLSFTDDGRIVLGNTTLHRLLGYDAGALLGRHVDSLMSVASRIFYQTHLFPLLKLHGRADEIYLTLNARDGTELPVLVSAVRRERSHRWVSDCVLMAMHQRNRYEDEILEAKRMAEEATRAKDAFLAVVSHELRTPLAAILGWVQMLKTGTLDATMTARAMDVIERNAETQRRLIGEILELSRIVAGRMRIDLAPVEPGPVVEAAFDVVRPAALTKGLRLESVLDPKVGRVMGDRERLQQVLWNLLSNAVKFTGRGGIVRVRVSPGVSDVEIAVSDTGRGIHPEFLPYVFDPFRQAEDRGRGEGDLGLGMAITKHLVELHGGTIRVESSGEGQGATFVVSLPAAPAHEVPGQP